MSSIFTRILNQEIPGFIIYQDELCFVLLDKFPAHLGQVLIIPKQEIDYIGNLDEQIYLHLWKVVQKTMKILDITFNTTRTCIVVEGFEVPHVHIKLYPISKDEHFDPLNQSEMSDEKLLEIQTLLQKAYV
jgi:histidine triad (HIT) family protein